MREPSESYRAVSNKGILDSIVKEQKSIIRFAIVILLLFFSFPSPSAACVNDGDSCDDGNACTTGDICAAGICVGSSPLSCDDGNVCTDDACDPASGCINTPNSASCDDGDACSTSDVCVAGTCVGGGSVNCDDGNVCTDDACDPASGCINTPNSAACDDGDACSTSDVCVAGTCVGGGSVSCDDGNVCTDDVCDPASGCINTPNSAACDDGDACTSGDVCQAGSCVSGSIVICGGVPPSLDLDADGSRSAGSGYYNNSEHEGIGGIGGPLGIADDDVLITDSDGNTITSAQITITNCKFGDNLTFDQNQFPAELSVVSGPGGYYVCYLTISGLSTHDAYQTALKSIYISNDYYLEYGEIPPDPPPPEWPPNWMELWEELKDIRLVSITVTDDDSETSNTAVASINLHVEPIAIRGIIYAVVQNALSSVSLSGATVSVSGSYEHINIYEVGDLHILEVIPEGYYTVNASHTGYIPASKDNVNASYGNDAGNPVPVYLCQPADADADVVPDGQINAGDYLAATRIVLGLKTKTPGERCHGDMNGDGDLTLPDLIAILQAVLAAP